MSRWIAAGLLTTCLVFVAGCIEDEKKTPETCSSDETNAELCSAAGARCGSITVTDSCGTQRTIASCGTCAAPDACGTANTCGCAGETDAELCAAAGATCGAITAVDGCGAARTIDSCGSCAAAESCGGAGVENACGCTPESDAELCLAAGAECGVLETTDRCGASRTIADCGTCAAPAQCGIGGEPNVCACVPEIDQTLCERVGATCGAIQVTDGCGMQRTVASCGTCSGDLVCAGDGTPSTCTPAPMWSWEFPGTADDLNGVWALGPNDAWIVGKRGTAARHDGTSLTALSSGTKAELLDVWASGSADVWAVGPRGTLLRHDGAMWRQVVTGFDATFRSITGTGADDLWILAEDSAGAFFVHGTAGVWSRVEAPLSSGESLRRVRAVASGELWAVGTAGLALRWDAQAAAWQRVATGASVDLTGVAGAGGRVWTAGRTDVRSWDGSAWSGNLGSASWIVSRSAMDLWGNPATGAPWLLLGGASVEEVLRPVLNEWLAMPLPFTGARAIHGSGAGDAWVVGAAGRVARHDGAAFAKLSIDPVSCNQVVAAGERAWALCGSEVYQRAPGGAWSELPALTLRPTLSMKAIWADGPNNVWVLKGTTSGQSTVFRWDGASWTELRNIFDTYFAISGSASHISISGLSGKVARYDVVGGTWQDQTSNAGSSLFAITAAGGKVWAVGLNGYGSHFNGTSWTSRQTVANAHLRAVHALDENNVWAVGDLGAASRWNGTAWVATGLPFSLALDLNLTNVYVEASDSVWAVAGASGTLFHWNGTQWRVASGLEQPAGVKAITGLSNGQLLSVGVGMQIAR